MRHKRHYLTASDYAKLSESFSLFSKNRYIFNIYTSRWNTQGTELLKNTVVRALKDNFVLSTELTTVESQLEDLQVPSSFIETLGFNY